jgi:hypothetical protein
VCHECRKRRFPGVEATMTDMCAELMHAHLELRGRGFEGAVSRADRVQLALKPSSSHPKDVLTTDNPLARLSDTMDSSLSATAPADDDVSSPANEETTGLLAAGDAVKLRSADAEATTLEMVLWFLVAAGQMTPWTSMGAFSAVFKAVHGPSILLELNTAYFVPALPTLIIAMFFVPRIDRWLGHKRGYLLRVGICQTVISIVVMLFPSFAASGGKAFPIAVSVIIGIFGGLGYGTIFSFNSLWPARTASVFSMGLFAPGFILLGLHAAIGFSVPPSPAASATHWYVSGCIGLMAVVVFVLLIVSERGTQLCAEMDEKTRAKAATTTKEIELTEVEPSSKAEPTPVSKPKEGPSLVWRSIWPSLLSVFVSIIAIVSITSFFGAAPSADKNLPATLFYVKNGCDFAGRMLTLFPMVIKNQTQLLIAVAVRLVAMPLFFAYILTEAFGRSDGFLIALVAVSAVVSGYLNTACYQLAAKSVNKAEKPAASSLMTLSFQAALLASIGLSFAILSAL